MKTSQYLGFAFCGLCLVGIAGTALYYNVKKDETIACLSARLLEMESRTTALETLPARILALETLAPRISMLEGLEARVSVLEKLPDRVTALETLPLRMRGMDILNERVAVLEHQSVTQGEQVGKLMAVSPAFAPHADSRLRAAANKLVQYGILGGKETDCNFLDNLARLENGDLGITSYPFIADMLGYGSPGRAVPASCVQAFLDAGADPKALSEDGSSALMFAVYQQEPEVVRLLLQAGADLNARDSDGNTALMYAVEEGCRIEIIKALLEAGADVTVENFDGKTVFDLCEDTTARLLLEQVKDTPAPAAEEKAPEEPAPGQPAATEPQPEQPAEPAAESAPGPEPGQTAEPDPRPAPESAAEQA